MTGDLKVDLDHLGYKIELNNIRFHPWTEILDQYHLKAFAFMWCMDPWVEFRKSKDSRSRILESGVWEFGTLIWSFWGLKSVHDCLNFKAKEFESKLTRISLRSIGSIDVIISTVLRRNYLDFKRTECCWLYAVSFSW
jgi:hypothetical protein